MLSVLILSACHTTVLIRSGNRQAHVFVISFDNVFKTSALTTLVFALIGQELNLDLYPITPLFQVVSIVVVRKFKKEKLLRGFCRFRCFVQTICYQRMNNLLIFFALLVEKSSKIGEGDFTLLHVGGEFASKGFGFFALIQKLRMLKFYLKYIKRDE